MGSPAATALLVLICGGCHILLPLAPMPDAGPDHALSDTRADLPDLHNGDLGFPCTCALADANEDGAVDLTDITLFTICYKGPSGGDCQRFDFDNDGVVGDPDQACMSKMYDSCHRLDAGWSE